MDTIPQEILLLIFEYLPPKDLIRNRRVCINWNDLLQCNATWEPAFKSLMDREIEQEDKKIVQEICIKNIRLGAGSVNIIPLEDDTTRFIGTVNKLLYIKFKGVDACVIGTNAGQLRIVTIKDGTGVNIWENVIHTEGITTIVYRGSTICAGCSNGCLYVARLNINQDGLVIVENDYSVKLHKKPLFCIAIEENEKYIATGSSDKNVAILTFERGYSVTYLKHDGSVVSLLSHGDYLISGSADTIIRVWYQPHITGSNHSPRELHGCKGAPYSIQPSSRFCFWTTCLDGTVRHWNLVNKKYSLIAEPKKKNEKATTLMLKYKDKYIISGGRNVIHIIDNASKKLIKSIDGLEGYLSDITLFGTKLVTCFSLDPRIHVYDLITSEVTTLKFDDRVICVTSSKSDLFVSFTSNGVYKIC